MAITYNPSTNALTVTGYSSVTPCTYTNLYNADLAGTLDLQTRTGVTAVDGAIIPFLYNLRPANSVVLGGVANDFYISVSNWSGFTDVTIRITGTDIDGAVLTEDITVTGNGTVYTTNRFKTATSSQVIAVTGTGSFAYTVIQGRWGVIQINHNNVIQGVQFLLIGDGSTATYFVDSAKTITIPNGLMTALSSTQFIQIRNNAFFTLGVLKNLANKTTGSGCAMYMLETAKAYNSITCALGGTAYFYACTFYAASTAHRISGAGTIRTWGCQMIRNFGVLQQTNVASDVFKTDIFETGEATYGNSITLSDMFVSDSYRAIYNHNGTVRNMFAKGITYSMYYASAGTYNTYVIDCDFNVWKVGETGYGTGGTNAWTGTAFRQQSFNVKLVDENNNVISGATIMLLNKDDTQQFSVTTGVDGTITEQIVTIATYVGLGVTNNNILPTDFNPFILTITKSGYKKYKSKFTLNKKFDEIITLEKVKDNNFSKLVTINSQ